MRLTELRDVWLKLDNTHYDGWEDVRKDWEGRLNGRTAAETAAYVDTIPHKDHAVFVTNAMYKNFGHFVGSNGKQQALVRFGDGEVRKFLAKEVISM